MSNYRCFLYIYFRYNHKIYVKYPCFYIDFILSSGYNIFVHEKISWNKRGLSVPGEVGPMDNEKDRSFGAHFEAPQTTKF